MTRPRFCPSCGKPFPQGDEEIADESILSGEGPLGGFTFLDLVGGYVCHCKQCGWLGDISQAQRETGATFWEALTE